MLKLLLKENSVLSENLLLNPKEKMADLLELAKEQE